MDTTRTVKKIIAGALLSGGVAMVGIGLGAGTAQATKGPFTWCQGSPWCGRVGRIRTEVSPSHTSGI
jgi:hypothetical protein